MNDSRTPVAVGIVTMVVNVALNLALVQVLGYRGLALGTSIAAVLNAVSLLVLLRSRLGGIEGARLGGAVVKIALATAGMAVTAISVNSALENWLPGMSLTAQIVRLATTMGASFAALAAIGLLLGIAEFRQGVSFVAIRLGRNRR